MTLLAQLEDVACRRVNPAWAKAVSIDVKVLQLMARQSYERWADLDAYVVRFCYQLLNDTSPAAIPPDHPAITAKDYKQFKISRWDCMDCKGPNDHYMVTSKVWSEAVPEGRGLLCFACIEKRLGRKLTVEDFPELPINNNLHLGYEIAKREALPATRPAVEVRRSNFPTQEDAARQVTASIERDPYLAGIMSKLEPVKDIDESSSNSERDDILERKDR